MVLSWGFILPTNVKGYRLDYWCLCEEDCWNSLEGCENGGGLQGLVNQ